MSKKNKKTKKHTDSQPPFMPQTLSNGEANPQENPSDPNADSNPSTQPSSKKNHKEKSKVKKKEKKQAEKSPKAKKGKKSEKSPKMGDSPLQNLKEQLKRKLKKWVGNLMHFIDNTDDTQILNHLETRLQEEDAPLPILSISEPISEPISEKIEPTKKDAPSETPKSEHKAESESQNKPNTKTLKTPLSPEEAYEKAYSESLEAFAQESAEEEAEPQQIATAESKREVATPKPAPRKYAGKTYRGTIDYISREYSYILCEELEKDAFVNSRKVLGAIDGDEVEFFLTGKSRGRNPEAEVLEVVSRKREEFVARLEMFNRYAFAIIDQRKVQLHVFIPPQGINEAEHGQKVVVRITEWSSEREKNPVGEVVRVLGQAGENETEIHAIMLEFNLPTDFDEKLIEKASQIPDTIDEIEIAKRRDLRPITTFTIDPFDAKDFDDALSIRQLKAGTSQADSIWEIGVHIADVTHYVHPLSLLEKEAQKRATSVYLVDRVVPMLPERLSNELCSLRPHEDKLTFSAVFEMNEEGKILKSWFGKTVIHSDRRFTYEEAQERIESGEGDFATEILKLNQIAKNLQEKRFQQGAIGFETQEVKFKLDENGIPIAVIPKERKEAHKLIEEFMLLANKKVAEFVYQYQGGGEKNVMVYRTHDNPDPEKLENLRNFAKGFGYEVDTRPEKVAFSIQKLIDDTEGKPEANVLQQLAIRSMAKAKYTTQPIGHFGLAFEHYSHFTSPIRRYPDMMAHRLLEKYLNNNTKGVAKQKFEELCRHASEMEKRAADAERASIRYKQAEYMSKMIGETFAGIITGITEWGIYVEITETACEGMARLSDLKDDHYEYDARNQRYIGQRTQKVYALGADVEVEVKAVDIERRTIDLRLVELEPIIQKTASRTRRRGRRRR
ncbi:ribonuclease R [Hugenholtzia roseola]|uniref:ribonuclease R n=1 Tax=Hugenholtzia roseola TaxID=1002 RepID=UPI00041463D0|nr:ribonuclease R [Hugenholtzia roseola]